MAPMRLEIITAEREVYADDVDIVVAPGVEGQLGVLPHHAPLMTALQPGEILIRKNGEPSYLAVTGGFMEVIANRVTILAEACEYSEEINEERAQAAMDRAQERLRTHGTEMELAEALSSMRRAQTRLNIARRRRPRGDMRSTMGSQPGG